jgi:hypothetical protein
MWAGGVKISAAPVIRVSAAGGQASLARRQDYVDGDQVGRSQGRGPEI